MYGQRVIVPLVTSGYIVFLSFVASLLIESYVVSLGWWGGVSDEVRGSRVRDGACGAGRDGWVGVGDVAGMRGEGKKQRWGMGIVEGTW